MHQPTLEIIKGAIIIPNAFSVLGGKALKLDPRNVTK